MNNIIISENVNLDQNKKINKIITELSDIESEFLIFKSEIDDIKSKTTELRKNIQLAKTIIDSLFSKIENIE